jgi:hypothetical protein
VLKTGPETTTVVVPPEAEKTPAPVTTEAEGGDTGAGAVKGDESGAAEPTPEILSSELILPPPPASTFMPEAWLITAGEVAGTHKHQPSAEDAGVVGTSSCKILVTPSGRQYAIPTELVDDPMLTTETLKQFQDLFRELYKFSMVCSLSTRNFDHLSSFVTC